MTRLPKAELFVNQQRTQQSTRERRQFPDHEAALVEKSLVVALHLAEAADLPQHVQDDLYSVHTAVVNEIQQREMAP